MKPSTDADRTREIRLIQIGKRQLDMAEEAYRTMLWTVARVHSSTELDHAGRQKVLAHLQACGFTPKARPGQQNRHTAERPRTFDSEDRRKQWRKVEALLTKARRPWAYAAGMAKRMFALDSLDFCTPEHLQKLIAALEYDKQRTGKNPNGGNPHAQRAGTRGR